MGPQHMSNNYKKTIIDLHNQITIKNQQFDLLLNQKDSALETLKAALKETINQKDSELEALKATLKETINQKDSALEILKATINQKDRDLETLKSSINQKDSALEILKATINQKDRDLETLKATINQKDSDLETLKASVNQKDQKDQKHLEDLANNNINKHMSRCMTKTITFNDEGKEINREIIYG